MSVIESELYKPGEGCPRTGPTEYPTEGPSFPAGTRHGLSLYSPKEYTGLGSQWPSQIGTTPFIDSKQVVRKCYPPYSSSRNDKRAVRSPTLHGDMMVMGIITFKSRAAGGQVSLKKTNVSSPAMPLPRRLRGGGCKAREIILENFHGLSCPTGAAEAGLAGNSLLFSIIYNQRHNCSAEGID